MKERDYSHLEGKEIVCVWEGEKIEAVVAGCEFDLGLTIQSSDGKQYLYCMEQKLEPKSQVYTTMFFNLVRNIKKGIVDLDKSYRLTSKIDKDAITPWPASADSCVFNK